MITISLDGHTLTPSEVMHIATGNAKVEVSTDAMARVLSARSVVERILTNDETVYGINMGFGALVHQRISPGDLTQLKSISFVHTQQQSVNSCRRNQYAL